MNPLITQSPRHPQRPQHLLQKQAYSLSLEQRMAVWKVHQHRHVAKEYGGAKSVLTYLSQFFAVTMAAEPAA